MTHIQNGLMFSQHLILHQIPQLTHGLQLAIVNDNGLSFVSDKFRNFCDLNSIEHILPTYINPLQTAQRKELCKHLKHQ